MVCRRNSGYRPGMNDLFGRFDLQDAPLIGSIVLSGFVPASAFQPWVLAFNLQWRNGIPISRLSGNV
jgi:hypothetical protein